MFIALPPPSFIGHSLSMFLMSLLVRIMNKTEWPQLYHTCTNWRSWGKMTILFQKNRSLSSCAPFYLEDAEPGKSLFPYNYYVKPVWLYLKVTFLWSLSLPLNSISSTFFSLLFKNTKRNFSCLLVPEVQILLKRSEKIKGNFSSHVI